jgi:hypothetical protein
MDDVGQAEYATLGPPLLAGLDRVAGWLEPGDFRDPLGREVLGVLLAMRDRSAGIDPVTVLGSCADAAGWPRTVRLRWR